MGIIIKALLVIAILIALGKRLGLIKSRNNPQSAAKSPLPAELQAVMDAADNGDADAAYTIWNHHDDYHLSREEAEPYIKKASEGGIRLAMLDAANYYSACGATYVADKHFIRYIETGTPDDPMIPLVEYQLGLLYWNSREFNGGPIDQRDKMDSYKWLKRAAKHGNDDADAFIATHF